MTSTPWNAAAANFRKLLRKSISPKIGMRKCNGVRGVVERIDAKIIQGWAVAGGIDDTIMITVNGKLITTTVPAGNVKFNGREEPYEFKRSVKDLWKYLGTDDIVEVVFHREALPIVGHGYQYVYQPSPPVNSRSEELFAEIELGKVFNKNGHFGLSICLNYKWQDTITDMYERARAAIKSEFGYDIFPLYGSMLGAVREGNFIGHDNDFDAGYISKFSSAPELHDEIRRICSLLASIGFEVNVEPTHIMVRKRGAWFKFDLFFAWFDLNSKFRIGYGYHGDELDKSSAFFKLVDCQLSRFTMRIPSNSEDILGQIYGPGWRSPDPGFKHHSKSLKREQSYLMPKEMVDEVNAMGGDKGK